MEAKPGRAARGANQPLEVAARINTLMVFKSEEKKAVKEAASRSTTTRRKKKGSRKLTGLLGLAQGMKSTVKEKQKADRNRKWYEFWKYF